MADLQSHSQYDIVDCLKNQARAHSSHVNVNAGMTVYIVPSSRVQAAFGAGKFGVQFTATEDMHKEDNTSCTWTTEETV
jgi:hypothetical protein